MTATERLIGFIDRSPSPYHAVGNAAVLLASKGFTRLEETEKFRLEKGKAYFAVRNSSALIAFRIPASADSFSMIAAHTDSPALRLKHDPENAAAGPEEPRRNQKQYDPARRVHVRRLRIRRKVRRGRAR